MALILADRVKETTTTTGTATYTLAGASTGFESFASIGDGNTTYYACTDGTDFEVGIGTYTASGTTLARTTILQSSNSDAAVSWGSGSKTIFCTQPAEKAVFLDASGHIIALDGRNLTNVNATTLDSLDSTQFLRSDASDNFTSGTLKFADDTFLAIGTGSDLSINHNGSRTLIAETGTGDLFIDSSTSIHLRGRSTFETLAKFTENGAAELYYDSAKKVETTSTGINTLGNINLEPNDGSFRDIGFGATDNTSLVLSGGGSSGVTAGNIELVRTGNVNVDGSNINLRSADATSTYAQINSSGAEVTGDLTLTSTDAGATENPTLDLYRNSASPADNDVLGHINFTGENDAGEKITYAEIQTSISDASDGTEGARLQLGAIYAGTFLTYYEAKFGLNTFNRDAIFTNDTNIIFEGATNDGNETTLTVADPTADRTITLPDATGTVLLDTGNQTLTGVLTSDGLDLGDNEKIRLGESQNLEIYHDASNTYIDQNDATLFIRNTSDTGNPSGVGIDIRNADNTGIEFPNNSGISIKRSGNTDLSFAVTGAFFNTDIVLNGATKEIKWRDTSSGNFYLTLDAEQLTGSDKTITLPNVTGTVLTTANSDTPTTTTSSSDADFVLIDDGGVMKKITPANLGVGSGGGGSGISAGKSIIFSMVFG